MPARPSAGAYIHTTHANSQSISTTADLRFTYPWQRGDTLRLTGAWANDTVWGVGPTALATVSAVRGRDGGGAMLSDGTSGFWGLGTEVRLRQGGTWGIQILAASVSSRAEWKGLD